MGNGAGVVRGGGGVGGGFVPVGSGLPPRRDVSGGGLRVVRGDSPDDGGSIIVPMARDRLLEIFERVQRPGEVASTLEGALTGQLWQQQLLFQAMVDTWPRLQKALREVKLAARKAPWRVEAHARRGEKPKARAERLAREVEELAMGYFMGHHVLEPHWRRNGDGMLAPVSTLPVPPRYYGYPSLEDGPDRLMLDRNGAMLGVGSSALEDFPKHRFLVAVNGGHSGHPAQAAPLRVLTGYWLAAVYGLKWFMQFAQLFGIPFRWATYPEGDAKAKAELAAMMGNLGSQGWAAFKQGVEMNFLESGKGGGNLAQAELLRLADEQCDVFVLGQTLTSSQGERGSQALGNVHMEVRREVVEGVCDFVGEVLTHQFIPAMVAANYGESRSDLPGLWARWPEPRDERGMAERDRALGLLDGKMPVERAWLYERHGVPVPGDGVVLFKEEKPEARDQRREGEDDEDGEDALDHPSGAAPRAPSGEEESTGDVVEAAFNRRQLRAPKGAPGGTGGRWVESDGGPGMGKGGSSSEPERKLHPQSTRGKGGAYGQVKGVRWNEAHHIPPASLIKLLGLAHGSGPAISMNRKDHRKTRSYGSYRAAVKYRARQRVLLAQGKFREAQRMDIEDIRRQFPGKYERQIKELIEYTDQLYKDPEFRKLLGGSRYV